jgi:hypothetical protein
MLLNLWEGPREYLYISICRTLNVAAARRITVVGGVIKWTMRRLLYKILM